MLNGIRLFCPPPFLQDLKWRPWFWVWYLWAIDIDIYFDGGQNNSNFNFPISHGQLPTENKGENNYFVSFSFCYSLLPLSSRLLFPTYSNILCHSLAEVSKYLLVLRFIISNLWLSSLFLSISIHLNVFIRNNLFVAFLHFRRHDFPRSQQLFSIFLHEF